ncbi:hypothetical protein RCL1_009034 [Eukaryota sp. TZLM3-RCL]
MQDARCFNWNASRSNVDRSTAPVRFPVIVLVSQSCTIQQNVHPAIQAAVKALTNIQIEERSSLSGKVQLSCNSHRNSLLFLVEISGPAVLGHFPAQFVQMVDLYLIAFPLAHPFINPKIIPPIIDQLSSLLNKDLSIHHFPVLNQTVDVKPSNNQSLDRERSSSCLYQLTEVNKFQLRAIPVMKFKEDLCVCRNNSLVSLVSDPERSLSRVAVKGKSDQTLVEGHLYRVVKTGENACIWDHHGVRTQTAIDLLKPLLSFFTELRDVHYDRIKSQCDSRTCSSLRSYNDERRDLTNSLAFALYYEDSTCAEAVSVEVVSSEVVRLFLHIGDVGSSLIPNSEVDLMSQFRCILLKLPIMDTVFPLSGTVNTFNFSPVESGLRKQFVIRPAVTLSLDVNRASGTVSKYLFFRSNIRVYSLTSAELSAALVNDDSFSLPDVTVEEVLNDIKSSLPLINVTLTSVLESNQCIQTVALPHIGTELYLRYQNDTPFSLHNNSSDEEPTVIKCDTDSLNVQHSGVFRKMQRVLYSYFATDFLRKCSSIPVLGFFLTPTPRSHHPVLERLIGPVSCVNGNVYEYTKECVAKLISLYDSNTLNLPSFVSKESFVHMIISFTIQESFTNEHFCPDPKRDTGLSVSCPLRDYIQVVIQRQILACIDKQNLPPFASDADILKRYGLDLINVSKKSAHYFGKTLDSVLKFLRKYRKVYKSYCLKHNPNNNGTSCLFLGCVIDYDSSKDYNGEDKDYVVVFVPFTGRNHWVPRPEFVLKPFDSVNLKGATNPKTFQMFFEIVSTSTSLSE